MTTKIVSGDQVKNIPEYKPNLLEQAQQACRNFADQPTKFGAKRAMKALDDFYKSQGWA
jgi:hypothetical protein